MVFTSNRHWRTYEKLNFVCIKIFLRKFFTFSSYTPLVICQWNWYFRRFTMKFLSTCLSKGFTIVGEYNVSYYMHCPKFYVVFLSKFSCDQPDFRDFWTNRRKFVLNHSDFADFLMWKLCKISLFHSLWTCLGLWTGVILLISSCLKF